MHPMTQTGATLLAMALSVLAAIGVFTVALYLLDKYKPGKGLGEKVVGAALLAVAAVGVLLMFIGSRL